MLAIMVPEAMAAQYILGQTTVLEQQLEGQVELDLLSWQGQVFLLIISGYGKVNISRALTLAAAHYQLEQVAAVGTAGGLDLCRTRLFGTMITGEACQYDLDFTCFGNAVATLPLTENGLFAADETLIAAAVAAARALTLPATVGMIASADRFLADGRQAAWLHRCLQADAVDVESGALAQWAWLNDIPYVALKVVNNDAGARACCQYQLNEAEALLRAQQLALALVEEVSS